MTAKLWEETWREPKSLREYSLEFFKAIDQYNDLDYLVSLLRFKVAPTSRGTKIASMVNIASNVRDLKNLWECNKDSIAKRLNLNYIELANRNNSTLVLFYSYKKLNNRLKDEKVRDYLLNQGYLLDMDLDYYFNLLKERFSIACPHEIGVFLGYPLEDIISFQCKEKEKCKASGYWKCYHDSDNALKTFRHYDYCKIKEITSIIRESVHS